MLSTESSAGHRAILSLPCSMYYMCCRLPQHHGTILQASENYLRHAADEPAYAALLEAKVT